MATASMKRKHLFLISGLLLLLLLLGVTGIAGADGSASPKTTEQYREEGFTVIDLPFTDDHTTGFLVLGKGVTFLKETETGGISRSENRFSLVTGSYQMIPAPNGEQSQYCILSNGRLFFGALNESSNGETVILDGMHEMKPDEFLPGGNGSWDQMMLEALTGQAAGKNADTETIKAALSGSLAENLAAFGDAVTYTLISIDQSFDVNIDFIPNVLPFYAKGSFTFYCDYTYDNPGAFRDSIHTIHMYIDLNIENIGIKSDEVVTDTYERAIITVWDVLDLATVKISLADFVGEVDWYMHARFGFRFMFLTFNMILCDEDEWDCWLDSENTFDTGISHVNAKGDLEAGVTVGPSVSADMLLFTVGLGGKMDFGFAMTSKDYPSRFMPEDTKDRWHVCNECLQEEVRSFVGPAYVYVDMPGDDLDMSWDLCDRTYSEPIYSFYFSNTFDECEEGECPHWAWNTKVYARSKNGPYLPDAAISYDPVPSHCEPYASGVTDQWGCTDLYMMPGKTYDLTCKVVGTKGKEITKTVSFTKEIRTDQYEFDLDIPVNHVRFVDSASGDPEPWPQDISFMPFFFEDVTLPDTVPALSGRIFTGWNTAEDGSGTSYAPGTKLTLSEDLTLWAQWQIAGDSWYVIYNANGGTKAPAPQIIPLGQDAVLSTELPEGGKLIFRGWTPDKQHPETVYRPGDTLQYDSEKSVVVLYALWDLSPVPEPICISFSDNGLQDAVLPADIWCEQGTWLQLEPAFPPLGSVCTFRGWSEDPEAEEPEYQAGQSYYFFRDTQLFAVWTEKDAVTLTFRDSYPETATGIPDPISIVPSMSRNVRIPEQIPQKEGLTFTRWDTDVYARGSAYDPGSVITLNKDTTLYALWSAHVTFDANGVENAVLPEDAWVLYNHMLTFEPAYAPLGSPLVFLGWSEDPDSKVPEHIPGYKAFFPHHTTLYAVWEEQETVTLTFRDSLPDASSGIPDPITISPSMSPYVHIPDGIPQKSGRVFAGWNTKEDGSGTAYAPGSVMTLRKDAVLWAQWQVAGDSWYVIYNANGGTKAPVSQVIPLGQDAVLTSERPEGGKLIFKGWTPDIQYPEIVYRPGDTLKYDSEKNVVVLYALWDLSPVPEPIHISFSANGLQDAILPADIWCEQDTWLQLEPALAPLDSTSIFRGWSENPNAKEPEYPAGRSYYFYRNTQLFAVWEAQETVTLTFRDSLPDASSGIPDPITILPSMSPYVRIPDGIPQKSGRVFASWNTKEDGSGTAYAPGSVITLRENTVLWARWEEPAGSWYIVFNASGGTKAPAPQVIPLGRDAVLTAELPENGTMVFKGWAANPNAAEAEYMPGSTLKYDSGKNYVVLYALWDLSPSERPVLITFRANGGQPGSVPDPVSVPEMVWFRLPEAEPSWDPQHNFLGWSRNPEAERAELKPGGAATFGEDTTLYAVWRAHYTVTSGAGSSWTKHSTVGQRFVCDGNIMYFVEFRIDGKRAASGVEITSGSTVADIRPWVMEKLAPGMHTVTFVYEDGEASAKFTVKEIPKTGDPARPALWLALAVIGIAGLALSCIRARTAKGKK